MAFRINKVLISDEISEKCPAILKANNVEVVMKTKLTKQELMKELASTNYDALLVRSATKVDADVMAAGQHLKLIGRAGTGVDNIDMKMATKLGIIVMNTPTGNSISAAELTCYMIMSLARRGPQAYVSMKEGKWARKNFMGNELQAKTLAVIGLGRIGREVTSRMQAFGMTTIGFDPMVSVAQAKEFGVELLSLEEIFPRADYITVHVPLIPQTKDLICTATLAKCKPTIRIINCARGGIVNEEDVLRALQDGKCAGLALDVFEQEPPTNRALIEHPLVVSTPHLGASTVEAQTRVAEEIAESIVLINEGKELRGALNGASMAAMLNDSTARWVTAARELARALQIKCRSAEQWKDVTIQYPTGEIMPFDGVTNAAYSSIARALTTATLVGLMTGKSDEEVNMINADAYAKEAGVKVRITFRVIITLRIKVTSVAVDDTILTIKANGGNLKVEGLPTKQGVRIIGEASVENGTIGAEKKAMNKIVA